MKAKATVWLAGSHHNFRESGWQEGPTCMADPEERRWKPLTEELLQQPIIGYSGREITDNIFLDTYRAAFQALGSLEGFVSVISFGVSDTDPPKLRSPKREWLQIYLEYDGMLVHSFSHDSRYENYPFTGLIQWVEEDLIGDRLEEGCRRWSTKEKWEQFFRGRIAERRSALLERAESLKGEARREHRRAVLIRQGLESRAR